MATVAKALGDPIRLQLVDVLRKHAGKVCVCELVPLFDLSQPTVSHHLKKLREAGIVGSERQGLWAYYYVIPDVPGGVLRMAELTETPDDAATCCAPEQQDDCCEPSEKADCCEPESSSCGCSAGQRADEEIREAVRSRYAAAADSVAREGDASCCGTGTVLNDAEAQVFGVGLYDEGERGELPDTATMASLGCGNPTAVAELGAGETVLDLGSGGGIDVLLSAKRVGPTGRAYGLDMTDEMLALARENQRKAGVENVEWLRGEIEAIPLPDRVGRRGDLQLRNQPLRRQATGAGRGGAGPETGWAPRGLRRDRRRGHGRGDAGRHGALDRLHRRSADPSRVRAGARRTPASRISRSPRLTGSTNSAGSAIIRAHQPGG